MCTWGFPGENSRGNSLCNDKKFSNIHNQVSTQSGNLSRACDSLKKRL